MTGSAWTTRPRPKIQQTRPCPRCGRLQQRTVVGNVVDYRHEGPCEREEQP